MKNPAAVALGSIKSKKKAKASRENGLILRTGLIKTKHFLKTYPYPLEDNEWKIKFEVGKTPKGRIATYNPDFYCKTTGYFIEVTTSKPNISTQRWKWSEALKRGAKLKVFWWEGEEITSSFI